MVHKMLREEKRDKKIGCNIIFGTHEPLHKMTRNMMQRINSIFADIYSASLSVLFLSMDWNEFFPSQSIFRTQVTFDTELPQNHLALRSYKFDWYRPTKFEPPPHENPHARAVVGNCVSKWGMPMGNNTLHICG